MKNLICLFVLLLQLCKIDVNSNNALSTKSCNNLLFCKSASVYNNKVISKRTQNLSVLHSKKVTQYLKKRKQRGRKPQAHCVFGKEERTPSCFNYDSILLFNSRIYINKCFVILKRGPPDYRHL